MDDPEIYKKLTNGGAAATVELTTAANGEGAYILKVGDPLSLTMYLELVVLPNMGYCVESSILKIGGVVLSREKYSGFSQMTAGFWLPEAIMREQYVLNEKQAPVLRTKEEMIAFASPETNVVLDKDVFDLSKSTEFKAYRLSTHLLRKEEKN